MSFSCDAMLGALARWLRFAGFDTRYAPHLPDAELAGQARAEGRWLLTRDRNLASTAGPRVLLLASADTREQIAELRRRVDLRADPERFFSRCSVCNAELEGLERESAAALVPPFVAATVARFSRCPSCARIYWPGTHAQRIAAELERLFESQISQP